MDCLIYTALSGASQTLYEQQISANNLAKRHTNGFLALIWQWQPTTR